MGGLTIALSAKMSVLLYDDVRSRASEEYQGELEYVKLWSLKV